MHLYIASKDWLVFSLTSCIFFNYYKNVIILRQKDIFLLCICSTLNAALSYPSVTVLLCSQQTTKHLGGRERGRPRVSSDSEMLKG